MPISNGIRCSICINGIALEEHGYQFDGPNITCSITSEDDQPFYFDIDFAKSGAERHDYRVYADGLELAYLTTTNSHETVAQSYVTTNGLAERRQLRFAKLETVDQKSDDLEARNNVLKDVGTLKCVVWRAWKYATEGVPRNANKIDLVDKVHEKSLKGRGVSHKTSLGDATYTAATVHHTVKIDPVEYPFATFTFRYASRSHLQSEGLISGSPSPEPSPKNESNGVPIENMTTEDLRREVTRLRNEKSKRTAVKRERSETMEPISPSADEDGDEVSVQSVRNVKRPKIIEVIDLVDVD